MAMALPISNNGSKRRVTLKVSDLAKPLVLITVESIQ
ncbi:hypothetical protein HDC92_003996 [Pedobacter sp. AK017]|nr:hypothetical protein [Pedobacter sp. AK017]